MLRRNLLAYLQACGDLGLADWVQGNIAFPCSMVDRITPRSPEHLATEMTARVGQTVATPIMAEDFIQWVLQDSAGGPMPDLAQVGVTVTEDVDPYEETKIRVLNGGHTALVYIAALKGIVTYDAAMRDPELLAHFRAFEEGEVLPALTLDLPFSKQDYLAAIEARFGNVSIGDTVARICADGMAKFPIFIRPTLAGCLVQGITPTFAIRSIASWYVFARHVAAGKIPFDYIEPSWDALAAMLGHDAFVTSPRLWGDLPETYPVFAQTLRQQISELEKKWPV
jgi:mannitol-1-phosphate/altronate dehydrogenase